MTDSAFTFQSDPNGCGSVYITHRGVSANEALALRDTSGNRAEKFSRRFASNRRKGAVLSIEDAQASETDDDSLDFTVVLNPAATGTVTVDYATADGTATQPSDYTATSGTLTFTAGQTTKTIEVPIVDDDMEDDGETLTVTLSNPSGAVIEDGNATGTISNTEEETTNALTAAFQNVPSEHDGEDHAFDIRILFDAALSGSWTSVRDAIRVTNGTHTKTHRVDGRSDLWNIGVEATSDADVTVTLAASVACGERGALCTSDSRRFETAISTVIDGPDEDEEEGDTTVTPLTATLQGMPSTHNGSTAFQFRIRFSEELTSYSYRTLRDHSVRVTQGDTTTGASSVRRMVQRQERLLGSHRDTEGCRRHLHCPGSNHRLLGDRGDVHGHRRQPATPLERSDSNRRRTTPAEHRGRNRRRSRQCNGRLRGDPVEGSFRHRDRGVRNIGRKCTRWIGLHRGVGDADVRRRRADEDDFRHRLRRQPRRGQRDLHHDPVGATGGAWLADATATGTITNTDPMPKAWLTRFGRTIASQAVDAINGRMEGTTGSHVTVGGMQLDANGNVVEPEEGRGLNIADDFESLRGNPVDQAQSMTAQQLLLGSSFQLSAGGENGTPAWTGWGRIATGGFEAEVDNTRIDGKVTSGFLGADVSRDRWLAGIAASFSTGDGDYAHTEHADKGSVESSLTTFYPYAKLGVSEKVDLWGLVGFGTGELELTQHANATGAGERKYKTDIGMRMGAVGVRGEILSPSEAGGLSVAVKSDAFLVQMESDAVRSKHRQHDGRGDRCKPGTPHRGDVKNLRGRDRHPHPVCRSRPAVRRRRCRDRDGC